MKFLIISIDNKLFINIIGHIKSNKKRGEIMKKIKLVSVLALLLVMFAVFVPIQAYAQEQEMVIVYAQVPDNWTVPGIWAWGPS